MTITMFTVAQQGINFTPPPCFRREARDEFGNAHHLKPELHLRLRGVEFLVARADEENYDRDFRGPAGDQFADFC